jgi:hypothetical protein
MAGVSIALSPILCKDIADYIQDICVELLRENKKVHMACLKEVHEELLGVWGQLGDERWFSEDECECGVCMMERMK